MGRITIFSIDNCIHCARVKDALESRSIPYTEVSITQHPQKMHDMIQLCGQHSLPQVFFNTRHVGGADATIQNLTEWDGDDTKSSTSSSKSLFSSPLERYEFEIGSRASPVNPLLMIPTAAPPSSDIWRQGSNEDADCNDMVQLPDQTHKSILEMTETLKKILPKDDLIQQRKAHKRCFTGKSAVKAVMFHYNTITDEGEAVEFCRYLMKEKNLICHVATVTAKQKNASVEDVDFYNHDDCYYRLQCYQTPQILNSYRTYGVLTANIANQTKPFITDKTTICSIVTRLYSIMADIEASIISPEGKINYKIASNNENFPIFEDAVCELQLADLSSFYDDKKNKLAFALNVYNLMLKYTFMKVGIATCESSRCELLENVKFDIGGDIYSLHDWLHGIIRGNRKPPSSLNLSTHKKDKAPFGKTDNRREYALVLEGKMESPFQIHLGTFTRFVHSSPCVSLFTMNASSSRSLSTRSSSSSSSLSSSSGLQESAPVSGKISPTCSPATSKRPTLSKSTTLQKELDFVSYAYCEDDDNVKVSYKDRKIRLAKVFQVYQKDLSSSNDKSADFLSKLSNFLGGTKKIELNMLLQEVTGKKSSVNIEYQEYEEDWTSNTSDFTPFQMVSLRSTVTAKVETSMSGSLHQLRKVREKSKPKRNKSYDTSLGGQSFHLLRRTLRGSRHNSNRDKQSSREREPPVIKYERNVERAAKEYSKYNESRTTETSENSSNNGDTSQVCELNAPITELRSNLNHKIDYNPSMRKKGTSRTRSGSLLQLRSSAVYRQKVNDTGNQEQRRTKSATLLHLRDALRCDGGDFSHVKTIQDTVNEAIKLGDLYDEETTTSRTDRMSSHNSESMADF